MHASSRRLALGAGAALGALLLATYLVASFSFARQADVMRYSSGLYDMDVSRVVADVTSARPAYRPAVHPLQKLLLAPIGHFLNTRLFDGRDRLAAARLMIAAAMTLQSLAAGWLAAQLAGAWLPGLCAALLCGVSFSSLLAATVPESAVFASLGGTLPLIVLLRRVGRPFGWREAGAWGVLGAFAAAFTLTQAAFWAIALAARALFARRGLDSPPRALVLRSALAAALALALLVAGASLQARRYPGTPPFFAADPLRTESAFLRTDELAARPLAHAARLLRAFAVDAFSAPRPARSDFLVREYGLDYASLSSEEAAFGAGGPAQRALALAVLLAVLAAAAGLRRADARFAAPLACLGAQLALHLLYGREYVLYSPHWHGVWVAVLVAAAWRGLGTRRARLLPFVPVASAALAAALLANNLGVLAHVHRELAAGLETESGDGD